MAPLYWSHWSRHHGERNCRNGIGLRIFRYPTGHIGGIGPKRRFWPLRKALSEESRKVDNAESMEEMMGRLTSGEDYSPLKDCGMVIEAVSKT